MGNFLFGFDNGSISGQVEFLQSKFTLSADGISWVVTFFIIIGYILGLAIAGQLSDVIGHKKSPTADSANFHFGVLSEALTTLADMLVWFRIAVGIGIGIGIKTTIASLYIAKVSPAYIHGRLVSFNHKLVSFNQLFNCIGNLVVFSGAAIIASSASEAWNIEHSWRVIVATGIIPAIVFLLLLLWIPESQRLLIRKRRDK